jgi:CxxC motif-containing protein
MSREFICILCPNGCEITVDLASDNISASLKGASCQRGGEYVQQELYAPQRNIATSVKVEGGNMPLVSVRMTAPIPKEKIFDVMDAIKKVKIEAPVSIGQVIIKNVLGLERDVIATKQVDRVSL